MSRGIRIPMTGRAPDQPHRAASPLELLFDLTFVVAIASLTLELAHGIAEGHPSVAAFLLVFFTIWWAWVNFTWFASAYDTDDVPYRLLTMLQMAGVLVLAAGVPAAVEHADYRAITVGYLVMRLGLVAQWLRAGIEHPDGRATAFRYAAGISLVQVGWLLRLLLVETAVLPEGSLLPVFLVLVALELAVPRWAEANRRTDWHPHHIAERYGLFTIIILGESVLAASTGLRAAVESGDLDWRVVSVAVAALVLLFALWWLYFLEPAGEGLARRRHAAFLWGYGHFGVFAALAAVGAGLEVALEWTAHHLDVSAGAVAAAVCLPVGSFLVLLWAVHVPLLSRPVIHPGLTLGAAGVVLLLPLGAGFLGVAAVVWAAAAVSSAVVLTTVLASSRRTGPDPQVAAHS
ncbi:low temperature requirement protein A [Blastococcus xanthinilyticus]|uniref:Low temperature requirement protein LtrA n=1 Tax=Blastococcus xanthinilyticus TaxID=1564164 RepID=A0A5S5CZ00_9ACTN|nr:low temperature requirement protein A [Blastococcus xanthinilyticus]TYP88987.1 low temperature requirement protein LtrA [Blastococcus xanthinilyticus]